MRKEYKKAWGRNAVCLLLILCLVGGVSVFGISRHVQAVSRGKILQPGEATGLEEIDCILVLGCGVNSNGKPSHMLEDRLLQGISLYKQKAAPKLLMSGDHGQKDYDEVNVMKQFALDAGVPSQDVFMDHAGFSTYESMVRARDVFQAKRILVVTQGYHLYRALYIADKMGLQAWGVASDPRTYSGQNTRDRRETLACVKDFFTCIIKPNPKFLGEAVPVSGNGDVTNDKKQ